MKLEPLRSVLLQALEAELGGVRVFSHAVACAVDDGLRCDWSDRHARSLRRVEFLRGALARFGFDPHEETPARASCRDAALSLMVVMRVALRTMDASAAEGVARACVQHAETDNVLDWKRIECATDEPRRSETDSMRVIGLARETLDSPFAPIGRV